MDRELLFRLIRESTSLAQIQTLLRQYGLPHAARNWDDLIDRRLRDPVKEGSLSMEVLTDFLGESEEYGRQHVFLYQANNGVGIPPTTRVRGILRGRGEEDLLEHCLILDRPEEPQLTDVRVPSKVRSDAFTLKFTGRRIFKERLGEERQSGSGMYESYYTVRYREVIQRAIWVARFASDGLLELRIASKKNSTKYKADLEAFWSLLSDFLKPQDFQPLDLSQAKMRMWNDRSSLGAQFRFTTSHLNNNIGTRLTASAGTLDLDLHEDLGAQSGIAAFLNENDAYCDGLNVWFLQNSSNKLTSDTHVILAGEINENLSQNCLSRMPMHASWTKPRKLAG